MSLFLRVKNKSRRLGEQFFFSFGFYQRNLDKLKRKTGVLVMYHGIDYANDTFLNIRNIGVPIFRKHLEFYRKHFTPVSVAEFFEATATGRQYSKPAIALTFDDGLANNFSLAAPLLESYGIPASFYVTGIHPAGERVIWPDFLCIAARFYKAGPLVIDDLPYTPDVRGGRVDFFSPGGTSLSDYMRQIDFVEKKKVMDTILTLSPNIVEAMERYRLYWELADDEVLRGYSNSKFITIGSHAWYHNNLANIDPDMVKSELTKSKTYLEGLLQREVTEVAYPDGSYSTTVKQIALELGFRHQLAVDYRCQDDQDDPHVLSRVGLYAYQSFYQQMLAVLRHDNV